MGSPVSVDPRDARIAELEGQLAQRDARIVLLEARLAHLEELCRRSSRNSSQPPSGDGPAKPAVRKRIPSGRKRGGQPGHKKNERKLVPPDEVDEHHDCIPEECAGCEAPLSGVDPEPLLHQVFELPEVKPVVRQYALHALGCECGFVTRANLPVGVPTRSFGPSVVAVIALLMGGYRLSKRAVQSLLGDIWGLPMSLGAIVDSQVAASEALALSVDEAHQYVKEAWVKHADETSWRDSSRLVWLWVAATPLVAIFLVQVNRSAVAAQALLGLGKGALVSDRYSAYYWWTVSERQVCWAHLIRDFTAIAERAGSSKRIGKALLAEGKQLFEWWHRLRDGTITRQTFRRYVSPLRKRVDGLIDQGSRSSHSKTAKTCRSMQRLGCCFWYFVDNPGVEPTNNFAERLIRHAVLWRKASLGTKSAAGAIFVGRVLTVQATLRLQGRHVLTFVRAACEAQLYGTRPPSLLPETESQPSAVRRAA